MTPPNLERGGAKMLPLYELFYYVLLNSHFCTYFWNGRIRNVSVIFNPRPMRFEFAVVMCWSVLVYVVSSIGLHWSLNYRKRCHLLLMNIPRNHYVRSLFDNLFFHILVPEMGWIFHIMYHIISLSDIDWYKTWLSFKLNEWRSDKTFSRY